MSEPWTFSGAVASLGHADGTVTLVEGASFCLSGRTGDIRAGFPQGLFFLDTRFLSRLELRVNGHHLEPLTVAAEQPFGATFLGRSRATSSKAESSLVVFRHRFVGRGLREEIVLRNYGAEPRAAVVELEVDVDFADLFEVKEGRVQHRGTHSQQLGADRMRFGYDQRKRHREVRVGFSQPAVVEPGRATWRATLPSNGEWSVCIEVVATIDGSEIEPRYRCGQPVEESKPIQRLTTWRQRVPQLDTDDPRLALAVSRSAEDLGALRIFDPDHPDLPVVAAGAPWFMTVFGRDSLLTAWMALPVDSELALGVLETLARFQGEEVNAETEEEPGRILHEMRYGSAGTLSLGGGSVYYGSVDASPLFVMLLGELRRWGLASGTVERLLPHADRALTWIAEHGDRDGDGYVEYQRATERGLLNQGWKDSWDAIRFADGEFPRGPIALCEVQGYVYAAYVARAHFASEAGDDATFERYRQKAAELKAAFNRDFWLADRGWYAMALDGEKRPVDALASNMGHCLWTGIVDEDKAPDVARHLLSPAMFSGWGIRTLATSMAAYNPVSYHLGSVWPHDNALCAAGLMRYGFVEEAHSVIEGMLDVAAATGGRLPELFSGLSRGELSVPAAYPTSCIPQAWAAASPLLFLRMMLRIDPWVPHDRLWLAPVLPPSMQRLCLRGVPIGDDRVDIEVDGDSVRIDGLRATIEVITTPRQPLGASSSPAAGDKAR